MPEERSAKSGRKKRKINIRILILLLVGIYAGVTIAFQQSTIQSQLRKKQSLLEQQSELMEQIEFLQNEESFIGTDTYVERAAREKFGWVKDGEILFKKKDEQQGGEQDTPNTQQPETTDTQGE